MKWYLAKLVYRIICGEGAHTPQFDEQLRLIYAEDDLHAFQKARTTGHLEEDNFLNNIQKPRNGSSRCLPSCRKQETPWFIPKI